MSSHNENHAVATAAAPPLAPWTSYEAIDALRAMDHAMVDWIFCARVCGALGARMPPKRMGVPSGDGIGAHVLAIHLCTTLDITFEPKIGVGSSLRECCSRLAGAPFPSPAVLKA